MSEVTPYGFLSDAEYTNAIRIYVAEIIVLIFNKKLSN